MALADFLPALPWLAAYATLPRLASRRPDLDAIPPAAGRLVSVIVPARNEGRTIETVVRSVLGSAYRPLELLVVDDQSTDDTTAVVERLAAGDSRLRLIRGAPLPEGWYGKPWACQQGYRAARGELLLFTDADTRHGAELLGRAVAALEREGAGLVTVSPHQRCESFWERVTMPQIWLLLALRYHPARVNRARRERDVIANGQFILTSRAAYEAAGTHAAVRYEVAEDLALAQTFLRQGRKVYFAFADRLMETRMYHDLPGLVEGWSKNVYLGGRRSFPDEPALRALVPLMLMMAIGFWLIPPAMLLGQAAGAPLGGVAGAAIAATILSAGFWSLMSLGMRIPPAYGLLYPLGAVMALYIVMRSTWRGSRRVDWRGRVYGEGSPTSGGRAARGE